MKQEWAILFFFMSFKFLLLKLGNGRQKMTREDYADPKPTRVARFFLGKFLCVQAADGYAEGMITETEAYDGRRMPRVMPLVIAYGADGSHVRTWRRGLRLFLLWYAPHVQYRDGAAGFAAGGAGARRADYGGPRFGAETRKGIAEKDWASGPGRVCAALSIEMHHNSHDLLVGGKIWIEDRGVKVPPREVKRTPRIGVDYAGAWALKPWRFVWSPADGMIERYSS